MTLTLYESNLIKSQLMPTETLQLSVKQDMLKMNPAPTLLMITNMRVVIIKRMIFNLKSNFDTIPFKDIASTQISNGLVLSSIFLRVFGTSAKTETGTPREGVMEGLSREDAKRAIEILNKFTVSGINPETVEGD